MTKNKAKLDVVRASDGAASKNRTYDPVITNNFIYQVKTITYNEIRRFCAVFVLISVILLSEHHLV